MGEGECSIHHMTSVVVATEHYHCSMYVCAHACTHDHRMVLGLVRDWPALSHLRASM